MLTRARLLSAVIHSGQLDKGGVPYYKHPEWVAERCEGEEAKILAYLHDTIEDAPRIMSVDKARRLFGDIVADALDAITRRPGESYTAYLERVKENPTATQVKLIDLVHNSDIRRIPNPTQKDRERVSIKYKSAINYLTGE